MINYVIMTSRDVFFVKTDITTELSVVDIVEIDSYSPVSSKFEKQSRMRFDQIHIKPTFYRSLKDDLLYNRIKILYPYFALTLISNLPKPTTVI